MGMDESKRWANVARIWEIIDRLRGEGGCPWDRKQTPRSVQTYLIEEAHEAAAAVRSGRSSEAMEELGDVLFMVFFLIHLYEEQGDFSLEKVCGHICDKMVRRHPHVFADATVSSAGEVRSNWERIKAGEKAAQGKPSSPVPESLPALVRAYRMLSRLSRREPQWDDRDLQVAEFHRKSRRVSEEAASNGGMSAEALGELLLSLVDLARLDKIRAEDCLHDKLRSLKSSS